MFKLLTPDGFLKIGIVILIFLCWLLVGAFMLSSGLIGCKTYEPIWIKQLPPECNMSLNSYKLYYDSKDKSATVIPSDYCYKKLHRMNCQAEFFGFKDVNTGELNPVDYDNPKLFRNYSQCMSELK